MLFHFRSACKPGADVSAPASRRPLAWKKLAVGVVVLLVVGTLWWMYRDQITLSKLAAHEAQLRQYSRESPVAVAAAAFALYVVVAAGSIPVATVLSLALGWYFGFWRGLLLVSFASTTGATIAFIVSRYLFREAVQRRFGERLQKFNAALQREGALYLFALRLTPAIPFFVINVVAGLTQLRTWTFWWVSQLGMLPATAVFIYAGTTVPDLRTLSEKGATGILSPQLIIALIGLGLFPLAAKRVIDAVRKRRG